MYVKGACKNSTNFGELNPSASKIATSLCGTLVGSNNIFYSEEKSWSVVYNGTKELIFEEKLEGGLDKWAELDIENQGNDALGATLTGQITEIWFY